MSMDNETRTERTTREEPISVRREEVRETRRDGGSNAGWWIAALVAIVAIVGILFLFTNDDAADEMDLQAARDAGRAEALLESANQQAQAAAAATSQAARDAAGSAQDAAQSAAESGEQAAQGAVDATRSGAANVTDEARDASATVDVNP